MKFKYIAAGYAILWVVVIVAVCAWEWNALEKFQFSYMEEEAKSDIIAGMRESDESNNQMKETEAPIKLQTFEIIADSSMEVFVGENKVIPVIKENLEDEIYSDYSKLVGIDLSKNVYEVKAEDVLDIMVTDTEGNEITPIENDYVLGSYIENEELESIAIKRFEPYLKHISGLVTFDELTAVMRNDSKAYKAVRDSQKSLEWMIKAKTMEFINEEAVNMQIFDENHFAVDVNIDLVKVADTQRGHTVEESVHYRVLYEKIGGQWYIYSFMTQ